MGQACRKALVVTPTPASAPPPLKRWTVLPSDEVRDIVQQAFSLEKSHRGLRIGDRTYVAYELETLKEFLRDDVSDKLEYVSETFDCDDFARVLVGRERVWYGKRAPPGVQGGSTLGVVWGDIRLNASRDPYPHAMNFFIDSERRVHLIEPQSDRIYDITAASTFWHVEL